MNWLYRSIKIAQQSTSLSMQGVMSMPASPTAASILKMFSNLYSQIPQTLKMEPVITDVDMSDLGTEVFAAVRDNEQIQFADWDETWQFLQAGEGADSGNRDTGTAVKESFDMDGLTFFTDPNGGSGGPRVNGLAPNMVANRWEESELGSFSDAVSSKLAPLQEHIETARTMIKADAANMFRLGVWPRPDLRQFYDYYKEVNDQLKLASRGEANPTWMYAMDGLMDAMKKFSLKFLELTSKNETGGTNVPPELPWLNTDKFKNEIKKTNINPATDWFVHKSPLWSRDHGAAIIGQARETHRENQIKEYNSQKTEFDHAIGVTNDDNSMSWLDILNQPFSAEPNDPRISLNAKTLSNIADRLAAMDRASGTKETSQLITIYVATIQMAAMNDQEFAGSLGNELEYAPNRGRTQEGLTQFQALGLEPPEMLTELGDNASNVLNQHFIDTEEFFADLKRSIKQRIYQYTPEDMERMKELGIAQRIPPLQYTVQERGYPGGGFTSGEQLRRENKPTFLISLSPTQELLDQKNIPHELLNKFHVQHMRDTSGSFGSGINNVPTMGWVGGFIDPDEKSMYVYEVQSDLMQNTSQMRDPRKLEEERKVRRQELEVEKTNLTEQIEQTRRQPAPKRKDPRAGLKAKIKRIQNDIDQVKVTLDQLVAQNTEMENQPGFDPNTSGQHHHNAQLIETKLDNLQKFKAQKLKMEQNLARIPAPPEVQPSAPVQPEVPQQGQPTAQPEAQPQTLDPQLQQKIQRLESRIQQIDVEITQTKGRIGNYEFPEWHDYRNVIENTFKDWIKIFFNTAVREAKRNNMAFLYIITSDGLMNLWSFGGQEKKMLFDRVYDGTAQFHGAEKVSKKGREFWRVNINDPELKVASNWFDKSLNKFGQLFPEIEPEYILLSGETTPIPAYILPIPTHVTASMSTV